MTTHRSRLTLAGLCLAALLLSACTLYLGPDDDDRYCDDWGDCGGDDVGPPPGGGFPCDSDLECAAGCYCSDPIAGDGVWGTCIESGYCTQDADCGGGMVCLNARTTARPKSSFSPERVMPGGRVAAADRPGGALLASGKRMSSFACGAGFFFAGAACFCFSAGSVTFLLSLGSFASAGSASFDLASLSGAFASGFGCGVVARSFAKDSKSGSAATSCTSFMARLLSAFCACQPRWKGRRTTREGSA